jgi:hypothetical protein
MVSRGASGLVASLATPMSPDSVVSPGRRSCSAACSGRLCSSQRPTRTHANNCGCPLSGSPQAALTAAPGLTALSAHHLRAPPLSVVEQCNISLRMLDVRLRRRADPRVHVREALTRSRPVLRASVRRPLAHAGGRCGQSGPCAHAHTLPHVQRWRAQAAAQARPPGRTECLLPAARRGRCARTAFSTRSVRCNPRAHRRTYRPRLVADTRRPV